MSCLWSTVPLYCWALISMVIGLPTCTLTGTLIACYVRCVWCVCGATAHWVPGDCTKGERPDYRWLIIGTPLLRRCNAPLSATMLSLREGTHALAVVRYANGVSCNRCGAPIQLTKLTSLKMAFKAPQGLAPTFTRTQTALLRGTYDIRRETPPAPSPRARARALSLSLSLSLSMSLVLPSISASLSACLSFCPLSMHLCLCLPVSLSLYIYISLSIYIYIYIYIYICLSRSVCVLVLQG